MVSAALMPGLGNSNVAATHDFKHAVDGVCKVQIDGAWQQLLCGKGLSGRGKKRPRGLGRAAGSDEAWQTGRVPTCFRFRRRRLTAISEGMLRHAGHAEGHSARLLRTRIACTPSDMQHRHLTTPVDSLHVLPLPSSELHSPHAFLGHAKLLSGGAPDVARRHEGGFNILDLDLARVHQEDVINIRAADTVVHCAKVGFDTDARLGRIHTKVRHVPDRVADFISHTNTLLTTDGSGCCSSCSPEAYRRRREPGQRRGRVRPGAA